MGERGVKIKIIKLAPPLPSKIWNDIPGNPRTGQQPSGNQCITSHTLTDGWPSLRVLPPRGFGMPKSENFQSASSACMTAEDRCTHRCSCSGRRWPAACSSSWGGCTSAPVAPSWPWGHAAAHLGGGVNNLTQATNLFPSILQVKKMFLFQSWLFLTSWTLWALKLVLIKKNNAII